MRPRPSALSVAKPELTITQCAQCCAAPLRRRANLGRAEAKANPNRSAAPHGSTDRRTLRSGNSLVHSLSTSSVSAWFTSRTSDGTCAANARSARRAVLRTLARHTAAALLQMLAPHLVAGANVCACTRRMMTEAQGGKAPLDGSTRCGPRIRFRTTRLCSAPCGHRAAQCSASRGLQLLRRLPGGPVP